ncbi:Ran-binding protein M homolog [Linum perenne]
MSTEMPTKLKAASRFALVSPDKLSVKFNTNAVGTGLSLQCVGAVQANRAVPVNYQEGVYYFEMRVKNKGIKTGKSLSSIGFTKEGFNLCNHLGVG